MSSTVFWVEVSSERGTKELERSTVALYDEAGFSGVLGRRDLVAIKLHVGERGNTTHVKPAVIKGIVSRVKETGAFPFLTDTSTLYKGQRDNAVKHMLLAHGHGFSIEGVGAPFFPVDGLIGNAEAEVVIDAPIHKSVKIAREVLLADSLIVVSHATGHMGTGLGGCIKNLGMGLASRAGKLRQHSSIKPQVVSDKCTNCGKCRRWCPAEAIAEEGQQSRIEQQKCIGCGECLTVCRYDAIRFDWGVESGRLQRSMAEHAWGAVKDKMGKSFFINVLMEMTANCDCLSGSQSHIIPDIGLLGSYDPVAVDMATLDLTRQRSGRDLARLSHAHLDPMVQILHAEALGMGSTRYTLQKVKGPQSH